MSTSPSKEYETPPSSKHVIGYRFGTTIDENRTDNPKKRTEGLSIDVEGDKENIIDDKPPPYENVAATPSHGAAL